MGSPKALFLSIRCVGKQGKNTLPLVREVPSPPAQVLPRNSPQVHKYVAGQSPHSPAHHVFAMPLPVIRRIPHLKG